MFAKLFGPPDDQVLVVAAVDSEGRPVVNVTVEAVTYVGSTDKGLIMHQTRFASGAAAATAFQETDEEQARGLAAVVRGELAAQLERERKGLQ